MRKIIYSPKYSLYNLGSSHPFSPIRLEMVFDLLNRLIPNLEYVEPTLLNSKKIKEIHSSDYVDAVENASLGIETENLNSFGLGTADNPISKGMGEGARLLCGGALKGAELILEGKANKVLQLGGGFHHAHKNMAAGFCLYNDLALAINEFIKAGKHVVYVDVDVHHGDAVQEIFESNSQVMTISFHESGEYLFPGTGWISELGTGMGRALKLNIPLEPFTEGESYLESFSKVLEEALSWYKPDVMVLQCGADAHFSDPLADLMLTSRDFEELFSMIFSFTDNYCKGNALFMLGGGYSISATVRIWTMLALKFLGEKIPEKIPLDIIETWRESYKIDFQESFHDAKSSYDSIPRKEIIDRHNKETVRRLLDAVALDWL